MLARRSRITFGISLALGPALLTSCSSKPEPFRRPVEVYYRPPVVRAASAERPPAAAPKAGPPKGCDNAPNQMFPREAPWNQGIAEHAKAADSDYITTFLEKNHTEPRKFQLDFSFVVLEANSRTPRRSFEPTEDHYRPDCDLAPVPIVPGGRIEGESSYACTTDGDCHLIVRDASACRLYEMWRANVRGKVFRGGCLAIWDLAKVYPETGRGEYCSSADAAGLPIAPFLFDAADIARGEIRHALRFVLPNSLIRQKIYVRPGTHSTHSTSGPEGAPPYAARLRLRRDFDLTTLKPAAQVIARALQRYGMILADGGEVTFTAKSDEQLEHKWASVDLGPHDLKSFKWTDFEVIDSGPRFAWRSECAREPLAK